MIIYLIRHGKTVANEKSLYYGFSDVELSKKGVEELKVLAPKVSSLTGDKYFTSGLLRTNQTLEILYGDVEYTEIENFKEINFGDFEMKSHNELLSNKEYINWISDIENYKIPKGESYKEFISRVCKGFELLVEKCENENLEKIVIIAHSGTISAIMDNKFKCEKTRYDWKVDNGKGYKITKINEVLKWENLI